MKTESEMTTISAKDSEVVRAWHVIDLEGQTLGRVSTQIASLLRGKHKPTFTPHVDTGDYVVCINADKIVVTGNKLAQKKYYRHSGFPGGIKEIVLADLLKIEPETVIHKSVYGMLPKGPLGNKIIAKLKIYAGSEHPHTGQNPQPFEL